MLKPPFGGSCTRADDETRTRDPHLGKVMRYQLRYIRIFAPAGRCSIDITRSADSRKTKPIPGVSREMVGSGRDHPVVSMSAPRGHGRLAQLVARFLHTEEVISSSLVSPTGRSPVRT